MQTAFKHTLVFKIIWPKINYLEKSFQKFQKTSKTYIFFTINRFQTNINILDRSEKFHFGSKSFQKLWKTFQKK